MKTIFSELKVKYVQFKNIYYIQKLKYFIFNRVSD